MGQQLAASNGGDAANEGGGGGADWVRQKARSTSQLALHAVRACGVGREWCCGGTRLHGGGRE